MHGVSLLWHSLNCVMLLALLRRLGATLPVALYASGLFAVHPGDVASVQWIACQTELIVTAFLIGATLCHARWRGWWAARESVDSSRSYVGATATTAEKPGWIWLLGSLVFFAAALGCRENAIMLPLVLFIGEFFVRREKFIARLTVFLPYAAIAIGYLALRTYVLGGAALPPKPYVIPPGDPEFLRFVFDKACYYLIGHVLLVPSVPFGGVLYFREHPLAFYLMSAASAGLLLYGALLDRKRMAGCLGLAWMLLFMGPVLPAFEAPHHLYLPGIGWAVIAMLIFRAMLGHAGAERKPWRWRRPLAWTGGLALLVLFGNVTYFAGMTLHAGQMVEDRVVDEIVSAARPVRDGDTLYVANLPCISHYVKLGVEERTGLKNLRVSGLTWAPRLLGNASPSELTVVDDRTIELRVTGDRYLSGPFAALARAATGRERAVTPQSPVEREEFRVECLEADPNGISALRFVFAKPLTREGVHLFWGSKIGWAWQVDVARELAAEKR
jgi:hypothetical protein